MFALLVKDEGNSGFTHLEGGKVIRLRINGKIRICFLLSTWDLRNYASYRCDVHWNITTPFSSYQNTGTWIS